MVLQSERGEEKVWESRKRVALSLYRDFAHGIIAFPETDEFTRSRHEFRFSADHGHAHTHIENHEFKSARILLLNIDSLK